MPIVFRPFSYRRCEEGGSLVGRTLCGFTRRHVNFFYSILIRGQVGGHRFFRVYVYGFVGHGGYDLSAAGSQLRSTRRVYFSLVAIATRRYYVVLPRFFQLVRRVVAGALFVVLGGSVSFVGVRTGYSPSGRLYRFFYGGQCTGRGSVGFKGYLWERLGGLEGRPCYVVYLVSGFGFFVYGASQGRANGYGSFFRYYGAFYLFSVYPYIS